MLGVHVQHFQNLYNAEIRNGNYCCDISFLDVPCVADLTDLDVTGCTSECQPYFEIRFEVCFADGACSIMENEIAGVNIIPATCISPLLVQLHSDESMTGSSDKVDAKKASFNTLTDKGCYLTYNYKLIVLFPFKQYPSQQSKTSTARIYIHTHIQRVV